MSSKDNLHHLIDQLPEGEMHAAQRFLEYLCTADLDTEPLSAEALADLREAEESLARGQSITLEEYEQQRGL